jgi:hypothetical protein
VKLAIRIMPILFMAAWAALYLPGPSTLKLHNVRDLVYGFTDMPGVDISLAQDPCDRLYLQVIGMELAAKLEWFVPGSSSYSTDRLVVFANGLIIVRATPVQHLAMSAGLATYRAGVHTVEFLYEKSWRILRAISRVIGTK